MPAVRRAPAVLALLVCAASWGVSWWPFRHLQAAGVHALWTTALVSVLACALLGLAWPQAWVRLVRCRGLWWLMLASGLTNASFNWAVTVGEVARVVLLFYLAPVWSVLLARLCLGERASRGDALRVTLALGGALLVLLPGAAGGGPAPGLADGLALLGGLGFAVNNILLRHLAAEPGSVRALAMFAGGALLSTVVALALGGQGPVAALPAPAWGWTLPLLALALAFVLSNLALQYGAARLPATVTAVVMPSEIVFATASALWWAGEQPAPLAWWGGALILVASVSAARDAG